MKNNINSPKLKEGLKGIKTLIIFGITFLLLTVGLGTWIYVIKTGNYESIPIESLISNGNKENEYANINANSNIYEFAENNNDKYYLIQDGKKMHIIYLDTKGYNKLNNEGIKENVIKITGTTKKIPTDVKTLAIDAYNQIMGSEIINSSNFEEKLGNIYLDTTTQPTDAKLQIILITMSSIFTLLFISTALINKNKINKKINKFTSNEWNLIEEELDKDETIYYEKLKLYLTENYVVSLINGIDIFSYNDIIWMYPFLTKQYGKTTSKSIIITTNDKTKYEIAYISNLSKKATETYEDAINSIYNKNKQMILGFSEENKEQAKNLYGIK